MSYTQAPHADDPIAFARELTDLRDALALAEGRLALLIKAVDEHLGDGYEAAPIVLREALEKAQGH